MKLATNPVFLQMALLFVFAVAAFVLGVVFIRKLRKDMVPDLSSRTPRVENATAFATAALQAVLQQLKEKEQELNSVRQSQAERSASTESIHAAVLANLDTGVVLFSPVGLVQQANSAAREILGYASVSGLHARDLFRGVKTLTADVDGPANMAEAAERAARQGSTFRGMVADYATPQGDARVLTITIAPAVTAAGECSGVICLVTEDNGAGAAKSGA
ncbi:MAG: hypothetical protein ACR2IF_08345 [Terriglobales bacterium]